MITLAATLLLLAPGPPAAPAEQSAEIDDGWALEAGVVGLVGAGVVVGLTISAAVLADDIMPAVPLATAATIVTVIVSPSLKLGSRSVREPNMVEGATFSRITGWIFFGLHLADTIALAAMIPFHWVWTDDEGNGWTPPAGWIVANGVLGAAALTFLTIDCFVSRRQAYERAAEPKLIVPRGPQLSLRPFASPVASEHGVTGAVAGVGGVF